MAGFRCRFRVRLVVGDDPGLFGDDEPLSPRGKNLRALQPHRFDRTAGRRADLDYRSIESDGLHISTNHPGHTRFPTFEKADVDDMYEYWR